MPRRPLEFDELLLEVLSAAPNADIESILQRCPDPDVRQAVRDALERESEAADFLEPAPSTMPPGGRGLRYAGDAVASAARRRLRRTGRAMSVLIAVLGFFFTFLHLSLFRWPWTQAMLLEHAAVWGIVVVCMLIAAAASTKWLSDRWARALGHAGWALLGALGGFLHALHELHRYGLVTPLGPHLIFIALLPLATVASLGTTLRVTAAASAASVVGLLAAGSIAGVVISTTTLADWSSGLAGGVAVALFTHAGLSVLQREAVAGLRLGSYVLEEKLGEGGMGEVWRARHPLLARPAAIKLIRPSGGRAPAEVRRRFEREAKAIAALQSAHTVRPYDFGVADDGRIFLAMELLDGVDLRALVERFGRQPVDRARAMLIQVCDSLAEAHASGLIHRDVKPANLMLCHRGRRLDWMKVLDFGSVADAAPSVGGELTRTGAVLGTPSYLAPEVLDGSRPASQRSDLYSLGCVAYWLLTGRPVFDFASSMMQMAAHLRDLPEPPSAHGPELPTAFEQLVLSCLAKRPEERPATAAELAGRLAAVPATGDWCDEQASAWWRQCHP